MVTVMIQMIPDLHWCAQISNERGVPVRCPFATVESCPRYYQSLSLLGQAGSTKITPNEDQRLLAYWEKSDLWPRTLEYTTLISREGHSYSNFCPEVAFDRFGYFASSFSRYTDEIDSDNAHANLYKQNGPANDWRWYWAGLSPLHYTECPIYSVLFHRSKEVTVSNGDIELPWYKRYLLELIIGLIVVIVGGLLLKLFG